MGPMSPGGHLVTTAIAGGAVLASTGSIPLTAGLGGGGVLLDVYHVGGYFLLQRRRGVPPTPVLPYYTEGPPRRPGPSLSPHPGVLARPAPRRPPGRRPLRSPGVAP